MHKAPETEVLEVNEGQGMMCMLTGQLYAHHAHHARHARHARHAHHAVREVHEGSCVHA